MLWSQSIVSGIMPLVPADSCYATLGCSTGHSTDDVRYDAATFGGFWPLLPNVGDCGVKLGTGIGLATQKIDQTKIDIGSLFEYEIIASGIVSKDFQVTDKYVIRPFINGSFTIGYISNNNVFREAEDQEAGAFPIDAVDYYCGVGGGIVIDMPLNWTMAADVALSRNLYGTFTDRSGNINHSLVRFQITAPLKILDLPIGCNWGWTYGKRDNVTQKELFVGAVFYF